MEPSLKYLQPEVLARFEGLDVKARLIVDGYLSGLHQSPHRGFSVEFAEHREYVPGDDLRFVDWKVFGRSDRYFIKQYEEETNFSCTILLDTSESMQYRSPAASYSKLDYARHVAAALAYLILRRRDAVGLATFDHQVRQVVNPSSQPAHLQQICRVMEQVAPGGETSLGPILHDLAERIRKRSLVILLSDLFDDPQILSAGLKHFRHCRHDVSLLHVIDPAEHDFPFEEPTLFRGMETVGEELVEPRGLRKAYRREFEAFLRQVQGTCRELQMDYMLLRTDQPFENALSGFLVRRMRRAGRV